MRMIRGLNGQVLVCNGIDPITKEETHPNAKAPGEGWQTIFSSNMRYQSPLGFKVEDFMREMDKAYPHGLPSFERYEITGRP
jgi:hypothetical protein